MHIISLFSYIKQLEMIVKLVFLLILRPQTYPPAASDDRFAIVTALLATVSSSNYHLKFFWHYPLIAFSFTSKLFQIQRGEATSFQNLKECCFNGRHFYAYLTDKFSICVFLELPKETEFNLT